MAFRDHYARQEEYIPAGPVQNPRVREFATESLSHIKQSEVLFSDKARFLQYMKALTNDILGIDLEPVSPKPREASPGGQSSAGYPASSSSSSSSSSSWSNKGAVETYVPMEISLDMREATNSSLSKMQSLRANLYHSLQATNSSSRTEQPQQQGGNAQRYAGGTSGAGQAWSSAVPAATKPPLAMRNAESSPTSRASANISASCSSYVTTMEDTSLFPPAAPAPKGGQGHGGGRDTDENIAPVANEGSAGTHDGRWDGEGEMAGAGAGVGAGVGAGREDSGRSASGTHAQPATTTTTSSSSSRIEHPAAAASATASSSISASICATGVRHSPLSRAVAANTAAGKLVEESGELDLSGQWQGKGAGAGTGAGGSTASTSTAIEAEGAPAAAAAGGSKLPRQAPQLVQRDSVDLSGLSMEEVRELTGNY